MPKLQKWLDRREIQKVESSDASLKDLRKVIERDLNDARVTQLSPDRRFATAYGAALNLASLVLRLHGYRVSAKTGHHRMAFEAASTLLGRKANEFHDYFDLCRRKRNKVDYDVADIVSEKEVDELLSMTLRFKKFIESHKF